MSFKDFAEQTAPTTQGVYTLNKGVPHLEDLPPRRFINVIENVFDYRVTEKLDGANLVFGFENDGTFFTSRETKGGDRRYSINDFSNEPAENGFKQAHLALAQVMPTILETLSYGEMAEVEVLYGRQPNAIVYGSNRIVPLRMLPGDNKEEPNQAKIHQLSESLDDRSVFVTANVTTTPDGITLTEETKTEPWKFAALPTVDPIKLMNVGITLREDIANYKKWLRTKTFVGPIHEDILGVKLNRLKESELPLGVTKDDVKKVREQTHNMVAEHQSNIKELYVTRVLRKMYSRLLDEHITPEEDIGIEGIVLMHPETGEQVKIVDKQNFTIINQFNHAIRNEIVSGAGRLRFEGTTLGYEKDIYGTLLEKFEDILGVEGIGRNTNIKKVIRKHAGENLTETLDSFTSEFKVQDVNVAKRMLSEALKTTLLHLANGQTTFLREWKNYVVKLPNGREIRYSDEVFNRTQLVFATTRNKLIEMQARVKSAETLQDIAQALYEKQLNSIH